MLKEGKVPANARTTIDYSSGKPKVRFDYPKDSSPEKQAYKQHSIGIHSLIILLFVYLAFIIPLYQTSYSSLPSNCSVELDEGWSNVSIQVFGFEDGQYVNSSVNRQRTWVSGANFTCDTGNYSVYFDTTNSLYSKSHFAGRSLRYSPGLTILLMIIYLFSMFITFRLLNRFITKKLLKSKRYCKWFPKAQANGILLKTRKKKYVEFNPKDVINNEVLIPMFSNVELDYKTSKDFNKYLKRIIIREREYYDYDTKKGKGKKKTKHFEWYTRFIFSQAPRSGKLEVIFQ